MNSLKQAIIELRWPLAVLVLAALLGAAMVTASVYGLHSKAEGLRQVENRMRSAQLALNNARREEADLQTYRSPYESLSQRGLFGAEHRLDWVEYMADLASRGRVQSLDYQIATQRPVSVATPLPVDSIDLLSSPIQLKMGFLHEGDLVRTLDELHQSKTGFYRIDTCDVNRKSDPQDVRAGENLVADCKLQWITMRPRAGKG